MTKEEKNDFILKKYKSKDYATLTTYINDINSEKNWDYEILIKCLSDRFKKSEIIMILSFVHYKFIDSYYINYYYENNLYRENITKYEFSIEKYNSLVREKILNKILND